MGVLRTVSAGGGWVSTDQNAGDACKPGLEPSKGVKFELNSSTDRAWPPWPPWPALNATSAPDSNQLKRNPTAKMRNETTNNAKLGNLFFQRLGPGLCPGLCVP